METTIRTISVDPSKPTAAERYAERLMDKAGQAVPRIKVEYKRLAPEAASESGSVGMLLSLVLGVTGRRDGMTAPMDSVTLVCRIGFGMLLLCSGLLSGLDTASIVVMAFGAVTLLGLLLRPAMTAFAFIELAQAYLVQGEASLSEWCFGLGIAAAVMAVLGPGHLSIDGAISQSISRGVSKRRERRMQSRRMSYEAYRYMG